MMIEKAATIIVIIRRALKARNLLLAEPTNGIPLRLIEVLTINDLEMTSTISDLAWAT
jgi:hypothetical protein